MGTTILRVASVAALAITMVAAVVGMARAEDKRMERTITVSASGEIAAEPDLARIQSGVTAEAETARDALAANTAAMHKVIAGLKSRGIDAKDIQTSSFRVEPRYSGRIKGHAPKIDGYRVHNEVQVHCAISGSSAKCSTDSWRSGPTRSADCPSRSARPRN